MKLFIVSSISSETIRLNETESKHINRVLRMKEGDFISITDGKGNLAKAQIIFLSSKKCEVKIIETLNDLQKRDYYLHMAICPTKNNDRTEWFLEKATEIGVDEITLLIGQHSERKKINLERYDKIVHSAVKQSLKAYLPKINSPIKVADFLIQNDFQGKKMIAHCNNLFFRESIKKELKAKENYLILIGPEGDFSSNEIQMAYANGFKGVSLSNSRLRTETAGVVAVNCVSFFNF